MSGWLQVVPHNYHYSCNIDFVFFTPVRMKSLNYKTLNACLDCRIPHCQCCEGDFAPVLGRLVEKEIAKSFVEHFALIDAFCRVT